MEVPQNRKSSFIFIAFIYLSALIISTIVFRICVSLETLFITGLAFSDLAATIWVFIWSKALGNSSVYDPYWSVAPFCMLLGVLVYANSIAGSITPSAWLLFLVLCFWSFRLTANWALSFKGLTFQDWRYTQFMEQHPKSKHLISFFGFHLFPTVVVFLCCIPLFYSATWYSAGRTTLSSISPYALPGAIISIVAVILQLASDLSMRKFRSTEGNEGKTNTSGLWKFCRHPNYLGEILMWWGMWLCSLGICVAPGRHGSGLPWWTVAGAIANTLMFVFISIPLMEKHLIQKHPDYIEYKKTTGMIFPKIVKKHSKSIR